MSIYNQNIPLATDDLSDSQGQILQNFQKANSSFGTDHYPFADLTVNNGKHNVVTTPAFVANPPTGLPPVTIAAEPRMYAFQDSANLGVLNYSRGPTNAVPTPLTHLQSSATPIVLIPNATTNVLDFTGLTRAMCMIYIADLTSPGGTATYNMVTWDGTSLFITSGVSVVNLRAVAAGAILQVKNVGPTIIFNNVYWTLDLVRTS